MSELLIRAIKEFEGLHLRAYTDAVGVPTIGYGHTKGVRLGMTCTEAMADAWLRRDVELARKGVLGLKLKLTEGQIDALTDFVFNLGLGRLQKSTLLRKIRAGASATEIQRELLRWNKGKVNGRTVELPGLTKRRQWEAMRWIAG